MKTSEQFWQEARLNPSRSYPAVSPASPSARQESERARTIRVTSGRKCFELYKLSGHAGSWQRTFMDSLLTTKEAYSTRFTTTWRAKATKRSRRLFFQLAPSERRIGEIGFGLWPTPNVPNGGRRPKGGKMSRTGMTPDGKKRQVELENAVRMLPTPAERDFRS